MALFRRSPRDISSQLARINRMLHDSDVAGAVEMLESLLDRCPPGDRAAVESSLATARSRLIDDLLRQAEETDDPRQRKALLESALDWAGNDDALAALIPPPPTIPKPEKRPEPPQPREDPDPLEEEPDAPEPLPEHEQREMAFQVLCANATAEERADYERTGDGFITAYGALQRGNFPEAAGILRGLVADHPDALFLRYHLASALAAGGSPRDAAEGFARFLAGQAESGFTPTIWSAYVGLSECLEALDRRDEAVATMERCVERYPEEYITRLTLSELYRRHGRFADAVDQAGRVFHDPEARLIAEIRVRSAREHGLSLAAVESRETRGALQGYLEQIRSRHGREAWDEEVMAALAAAMEREGDLPAAAEVYARLSRNADSDTDRDRWAEAARVCGEG